MGKADKVEARRQEKEEEKKSKKLKGGTTTTLTMSVQMSSEPVAEHNNNDCEMNEDEDFLVNTKSKYQQNRTEVAYYIAEVSRYGVSPRCCSTLQCCSENC